MSPALWRLCLSYPDVTHGLLILKKQALYQSPIFSRSFGLLVTGTTPTAGKQMPPSSPGPSASSRHTPKSIPISPPLAPHVKEARAVQTLPANGHAGADGSAPEGDYCRATLVVCPLVAVIQWRQEIARFTAPGSVQVRKPLCRRPDLRW